MWFRKSFIHTLNLKCKSVGMKQSQLQLSGKCVCVEHFIPQQCQPNDVLSQEAMMQNIRGRPTTFHHAFAGIPEEPSCSASFTTATGTTSKPRAAPGNWVNNILIFESPLEINAWLHGKGNGNNNVERLDTP